MKKLLAVVIAAVMAIVGCQQAQAQKGESTFGIQAGYTSKNNSAIAGLFYQYGLSDHLRIAPAVGCVFRHQDMDAFTIDVNMHYPIQLTGENAIQLYPLLGLDFTSWNLMKVVSAETDDVSTRSNKFGFNLGAGYQMKITDTMKLKAEAQYTLTAKYSTFVISVGIGYVF